MPRTYSAYLPVEKATPHGDPGSNSGVGPEALTPLPATTVRPASSSLAASLAYAALPAGGPLILARARGCMTAVPAPAAAAASGEPSSSRRTTPEDVRTGRRRSTAAGSARTPASEPYRVWISVMYSIGVASPVPRSVNMSP